MTEIPDDLHRLLKIHGQEHVFDFWHELTVDERRGLIEQIRTVDFGELRQLYARREETYTLPELHRLRPLPHQTLTADARDRDRSIAEEALRAGQIAFLVVAGGQGSRLGFDKPKGMYPIGPVSERTLFHIYGQTLAALSRRFDAAFPFLVMTSPATDAETRRFFAQEGFFGLPEEDVWFFQQATMPALDLASGNLLLEQKSRLFLSPNGHGGSLTGLVESGLLERLKTRGIRSIYYFQVDNPLVNLGDLDFIGRHLSERADVSNKVIAKQHPLEKLGNFAIIDGRLGMIEYSDLTEELAHLKDDSGALFFWAGNPAIHLLDLAFLDRLTHESAAIPWHVAKKKAPYLDARGNLVLPEQNNALKFERFVFDVLPLAERWSNVAVLRKDEFEPLKNETGSESPETVRRALTNQAAGWLESIGVSVPRDDQGAPAYPLEISPLFALDAEELARKLPAGYRVEKAVLLE